MFNTYNSIDTDLTDIKYKFSMQFETILEEYEVVSRASTTSMIVKPYTSFQEAREKALERATIYIRSHKNDAGNYESLRFTTAYKKNLVNSKTNDYVVNLEQISNFHINASSAQNMDVHFADTGNGSTRTLTVHNCFDYLNYILQPYTQIEQQRVFYDYEDISLTVAQPALYSNYSYPENSKVKEEKARKESEIERIEKRIHVKNINSNKQ